MKDLRNLVISFLVSLMTTITLSAQAGALYGVITNELNEPQPYVHITLSEQYGAVTSLDGSFRIASIEPGTYELRTSLLGYKSMVREVLVEVGDNKISDLSLRPDNNTLDEIVVTGTLKAVRKSDSPVPVDVYTPAFFKKNPTANVYEALQNVNGVRPNLNCQVCNTGDIQINGLDGPYTLVLIDGMPIVSSLGTVYGLSGIPNAMIERMEIVKGPASSLYGSEAIGGLINIITKDASKAPVLSLDLMGTSWAEYNADVALKLNLGEVADVFTGVNYFNYSNPQDRNNDNFTDLAIQDRISIFQKWNFKRKDNRLFSLAARYFHEDRWGGELDWTPEFRGTDQIYGESIFTDRFELLGQYQLATVNNMMLTFSYNSHQQDSFYGDEPYLADQEIAFTQLTWNKQLNSHDLLVGSSFRYTYYDDNTTATSNGINDLDNDPDHIYLPGIFVQDEIKFNPKHTLLLGLRYDYNDDHGSVFTPRVAYKWGPSTTDNFRINIGTGFRVVSLFTEDHAALTGSRDVVVAQELLPEQSINVNLNYTKRLYMVNGGSANIELSSWFTHFSNIILPDYDSNPNQIIYDNLNGHAITQGVSVSGDLTLPSGLSFDLGATLMDVSTTENGVTQRQILTERFAGNWSASYKLPNRKWGIDYTANLYGPLRLPLLGELDPRPEFSPWWSIQNIQLTHRPNDAIEFYGGIKNILDWTPWKNLEQPIIARSFDPFDSEVSFDAAGEVVPTSNNPFALTFDPEYVYAPNQGRRLFFGLRYTFD
jgi:outer membrane receptor for ferrienterochelin and colicins